MSEVQRNTKRKSSKEKKLKLFCCIEVEYYRGPRLVSTETQLESQIKLICRNNSDFLRASFSCAQLLFSVEAKGEFDKEMRSDRGPASSEISSLQTAFHLRRCDFSSSHLNPTNLSRISENWFPNISRRLDADCLFNII